MGQPIDTYREGYEQGRKQTLGGALAEATMGMLRDDPGGHFAAGYRDGAAGKRFSPPGAGERKKTAKLNPFDDKVAIKTVCPNCGALDWFEWKFLGRLKDPVCGHIWYVGSGAYAMMQVRASFGAGSRFTKYLTSGISGEGAWIAKALGWFTGTILGIAIRLEFGLLMIPIQAIVGLRQPHKSRAEIVSRSLVAGVFVVALAVFVYEIRAGTGMQAVMVQQPSVTQLPSVAQLKSIVGTWKILSNGHDTKEVWTFKPNGRYQGRALEHGNFSGAYSLSSNTLVMQFPEIEMTAQIVARNGNTITIRRTKIVEVGTTSNPNDEYELVRVASK